MNVLKCSLFAHNVLTKVLNVHKKCCSKDVNKGVRKSSLQRQAHNCRYFTNSNVLVGELKVYVIDVAFHMTVYDFFSSVTPHERHDFWDYRQCVIQSLAEANNTEANQVPYYCPFIGGFPHDDVIKWNHFPRYWPFVGEFTRHRWITRTKASDAELWCFLWSAPE